MSPISPCRVAFDIDDTVIDSRPIIKAFFNHLTDIGVKHDPQIYEQTHCIHSALFGADSNTYFEHFYAVGKAPQPHLMYGARFGLRLIRKKYHVPLVTSRSNMTIGHIMDHLQTFVMPGCHRDHITGCGGLPKREAIERLRPAYYVENSVAEINHLLGIEGTKIIQYPSLLNGVCPIINHPDVYCLKACKWVGRNIPEEKIFHAAWHEIQYLVLA